MQIMKRSAGILAAAAVLAGCSSDGTVAAQNPDIVTLASGTAELSTLTAAVQAAQLDGALSGAGPFTVFAPVNSAFAALDPAALDRVLADRELLQKVLTYHVVPGAIYAADLSEGAQVTTLEGSSLTITLAGGAKVDGVRIISTDIRASNGVVHLIDGVLLDNLDIVDVAKLNGFSTLLGAATQAGLVDALRGSGSGAGLTVFAPTDAAFAALGSVPSDIETLQQVLLYHVVDAVAPSSALSNGQNITTLQGGAVTVDLAGGVRIRGAGSSAAVVVADVAANNGIIHVIDAVLLPSSN
jgi:transforming growth factor-beta-induced protein